MSAPTESTVPTASDKLIEIGLPFNEIDALVSAIYELWNDDFARHKNTIYGLVMAIERSNDAIGRLAGVIE
jgi:hypothetical protein